ncbi:MAG: VOC family protein [bacterium]
MKVGSIVVRCVEFDKMYDFWRQALHYVPSRPPEKGWVILRDPKGRGPNISLDLVPEEKRPAWLKRKRSRLHLDLYTSDQAGEVERLVALGATRYPWRYEHDADYVVLEDPDGNLFCVVQVPTGED